MVIKIILLIIILVITYFVFKKMYKKCEDNFEKILFWIYIVLSSFIMILYYCDKFNVPSALKWSENVDTQNWLTVLSNFGTTILAEVVGGFILIFVTKMQIDENNSFNLKRDSEERRINNLPLLTYTFIEFYTGGDNEYFLPSNFDSGKRVDIVLKVKNIGMNAIRKCYIEISGETLKCNCYCPLDIQSSLDKGEEKIIAFFIELPVNTYKYNFTFYYEDLLHNWYSQDLKLDYEVTNFSDGLTNYVKYLYKLYDEKIIEEPKIKFNIDKYC